VAQESDSGKLKALTGIASVSGLAALPSPTGGVPMLPNTQTSLADMSLDQEQEAALAALMEPATTAGVAEKTVDDGQPSATDVSKVAATVAVAQAAASSAQASQPAAAAGSGDPDLDALLAELDGKAGS
jgi:hypothetical protein